MTINFTCTMGQSSHSKRCNTVLYADFSVYSLNKKSLFFHWKLGVYSYLSMCPYLIEYGVSLYQYQIILCLIILAWFCIPPLKSWPMQGVVTKDIVQKYFFEMVKLSQRQLLMLSNPLWHTCILKSELSFHTSLP